MQTRPSVPPQKQGHSTSDINFAAIRPIRVLNPYGRPSSSLMMIMVFIIFFAVFIVDDDVVVVVGLSSVGMGDQGEVHVERRDASLHVAS